MLFGASQLLGLARDEEERRGIRQYAIMAMALTLGFILLVVAIPRPLPATLAFLGMMLGFGVLHFRWLPQVTARRKSMERSEDPVAFVAAERTRRRQAIWGFTAGAVMGGGAIVAAWFF